MLSVTALPTLFIREFTASLPVFNFNLGLPQLYAFTANFVCCYFEKIFKSLPAQSYDLKFGGALLQGFS